MFCAHQNYTTFPLPSIYAYMYELQKLFLQRKVVHKTRKIHPNSYIHKNTQSCEYLATENIEKKMQRTNDITLYRYVNLEGRMLLYTCPLETPVIVSYKTFF